MTESNNPVLVTGGTGLIGGNVCRILAEQGRPVRALVRAPQNAAPLSDLGVELVTGDITDAASVRAAIGGCSAVVHAAAVLGGTSQDIGVYREVNAAGTAAVFDAAAEEGQRVVFTASLVVFDETRTLTERSAVQFDAADPYTVTKREAFLDARKRAENGQDVVVVLPGATYGPAPVTVNAMSATSFNRIIRGAVNGKLKDYPSSITMPFSYSEDVAAALVSAIDNGRAGDFYLAFGHEDALPGVDFFNLACEFAGVGHRLNAVEPDPDDPEVQAAFGESMVRLMRLRRPTPAFDNTHTREVLGYSPVPIETAMRRTVDWLRAEGQIS